MAILNTVIVYDVAGLLKTASGSVIAVSDALAKAVKSLDVDINAVQDLHGYNSPWVGGAGKNKFNQADSNGLTVDMSVYAYNDAKALAQINTLQAGTYTLTWKAEIVQVSPTATDPSTGRYGLFLRASNNGSDFNVNGQLDVANPTAGQIIIKSVSFTLTADYVGKFQYFWIYCGRNVNGGNPDTCYFYDVQIESGSTATAFEPYENLCPISGWSNVNVYREAQYDAGATPYATINLNGTVYGGSLDVTTGVLTVTHHFATYDGTENWSSGTNYYVLFSQPNSKGNNDLTQIANWLKAGGSSNYTTYGCYRAQANGAICVGTIGSPWSSVSDFKTALSTNPLTICYELATPQTVQLSPTTVRMLVGNNTLWANSGDSELQYWATQA